MFWKSLKGRGIQLLSWLLKTLFSDWYYCQTWKWGGFELAARNKLLDYTQTTKNIRLYRKLIQESRNIIYFIFNKHYNGSYLEEAITKELSIRDFKQIYLVFITLFLIRLESSELNGRQEELFALFPGEDALIKQLVQEISARQEDESKQAIFAWTCILDIIDQSDLPADGVWRGVVVLFTEQSSKMLRDRWP
jgi:hypothetical protein